jgi:hypothetical protein
VLTRVEAGNASMRSAGYGWRRTGRAPSRRPIEPDRLGVRRQDHQHPVMHRSDQLVRRRVDDRAALVSATAPVNSTNYRNHGDYVTQRGGGADAAHSCIGMPIH